MEAYAIVIEGNEISEAGYAALAKSSYNVGNEFKLKQFKAITPDIVEKDMNKNELPFHISYIMNKFSRKKYQHEEEKLTYRNLFENILQDKYFPLQTFHHEKMIEKDRRVWKFLNFYFLYF